jgi:hypothetical protein
MCFVVLYGCETWSFTLRKEHRLRVFENRVLREVFVLKTEQVTREWRRLRNEELHDVYRSPNIIREITSRRMRWAKHVARGDLVGKPDVRRPFGRPRRIWEDDIKTDFSEMILRGMGWIDLDQERDSWLTLVNAIMNLRVPLHAKNFWISSGTASLS